MNIGINAVRVLSVILLICCFTVPIFDLFSGFFPTDDAWTAADTMEEISDDMERAMRMWPVRLHLHSWIPAILLCILAMVGKPKLILVFSALGVGSMIWVLISYVIDQGEKLPNGWRIIDPEDGSVGFGYWLILGLFVICTIISICNVYSASQYQEYSTSANRYANESSAALQKLRNINNDGSTNARSPSPANLLGNEPAAEAPRTTPPINASQAVSVPQGQQEAPLTPWTCRNCGEINPSDAKYCGHCGLFR